MWTISYNRAVDVKTCLQRLKNARRKLESEPPNIDKAVDNLLVAQLLLHDGLAKVFGQGVFSLIRVMGWNSLVQNTCKLAQLVSSPPHTKRFTHRYDTDVEILFERTESQLKISLLSQAPRADESANRLAELLGRQLCTEVPFIPSTELSKQNQV